eukprot:3738052-Rhodomonas_salina.1
MQRSALDAFRLHMALEALVSAVLLLPCADAFDGDDSMSNDEALEIAAEAAGEEELQAYGQCLELAAGEDQIDGRGEQPWHRVCGVSVGEVEEQGDEQDRSNAVVEGS